jgi:hypothetical protein
MGNSTYKYLALCIACGMFSLTAEGQVPKELNGTWVIDAKQTEEYLKKLVRHQNTLIGFQRL